MNKGKIIIIIVLIISLIAILVALKKWIDNSVMDKDGMINHGYKMNVKTHYGGSDEFGKYISSEPDNQEYMVFEKDKIYEVASGEYEVNPKEKEPSLFVFQIVEFDEENVKVIDYDNNEILLKYNEGRTFHSKLIIMDAPNYSYTITFIK